MQSELEQDDDDYLLYTLASSWEIDMGDFLVGGSSIGNLIRCK